MNEQAGQIDQSQKIQEINPEANSATPEIEAYLSSDESTYVNPCHAVLAYLSVSYPPLVGRLPTCYSAVRH